MSWRLGSPRQPALTCSRGRTGGRCARPAPGVPAQLGTSCRAIGVHRGRPPAAPVWCQRSRGGERERIVPRKTENADRFAFRRPTHPQIPGGTRLRAAERKTARSDLRVLLEARPRTARPLPDGQTPVQDGADRGGDLGSIPTVPGGPGVSRSTMTRLCSSGFHSAPGGSGRSTGHRRRTPRRPGLRPGRRSPSPRHARRAGAPPARREPSGTGAVVSPPARSAGVSLGGIRSFVAWGGPLRCWRWTSRICPSRVRTRRGTAS